MSQTQELVRRGVEQVKASGTPATAVATQMVLDSWASMSEEAKQELAGWGLGRMINDAIAKERADECMGELHREHDERARQREAEHERTQQESKALENQREAFVEKYGKGAFRDRVKRIHELLGECQRKMCRDTNTALNCIGGLVVFLKTDEELQQIADELRRAKEARKLRDDKIWRIHQATRCGNKCCRDSAAKMENCVAPILALPEEDRQKEIARRSEIYGGGIDTVVEFLKLSHEQGADQGYTKAVEDMRSILLIASDGTMKPLLDFTLADVKKWERKSTANARAWMQRRKWFGHARQELTEAGVDCISQLSPEKLREMAEAARKIWKNGAKEKRHATAKA